jgi:hypothetical protein
MAGADRSDRALLPRRQEGAPPLMDVKADAKLGAHQRGVVEPAAGASERCQKYGFSRLDVAADRKLTIWGCGRKIDQGVQLLC